MKTCLPNERGVALILVILIVSILVAVVLEMNRSSRAEIHDATGLSDSVKLLYLSKSGFHAGIALLLLDKNNFDALFEDWADDRLIAAKSAPILTDGGISVSIEDESGKIPVNRLVAGNAFNEDVRRLMFRLLSQPEFGLEDRRIAEILEAIKDWMDKDDEITGSGGAERAYYAALENPYAPKNGLLDCIEELLMIKGMTKKIYYGTKETPGLRHLLTVYGDGRININTAPKPVLRALSDNMTAAAADDLDQYRRNRDHDLARPTWYRQVPGMDGITIDSRLITTASSLFRIRSTASRHQMTGTVSGVVKRESGRNTAKILSWKWQ